MSWFESAGPCRLDGCMVIVRISQRPDGRYRVQHGDGEENTTFLTLSELFTTRGVWPFARTRHDEAGWPRLPESMGQQALAALHQQGGQ